MTGRRRVLSSLNGDVGARTLFVGEAPGRLGAERHGIPFHGDAAGRNFESLLAACNITRDEVFITNAVLCNPQTPEGHNSQPTKKELANCKQWLQATVELISPTIVVALGAVALEALGTIEPHSLRVSQDVGTIIPWHGRKLAVLFHPSNRTLTQRLLERQINDWQSVLGARNSCHEF